MNKEQQVNQLAESPQSEASEIDSQSELNQDSQHALEEEGGPNGLEPTRYGDWEKNGRCIDF